MKNKLNQFALVFFLSALMLFNACHEENNIFYDDTPPDPPENLFVLAGDNRVDVTWDHNWESDLAGYNIYYNTTYEGKYTLIGTTEDNYFIDYDAINGDPYYYAIAAFDFNGNESELSYDVAYAIARPEGFNEIIFDFFEFEYTSGYGFEEYSVLPYNDERTDIFFENYEGTFWVNVWADTEIQDMGETQDIYDIPEAPISGWVPLVEGENVKYVQVEIGHTYVVSTNRNHYAKFRVSEITGQRMVFDWAFQLIPGVKLLKSGFRNSKVKVKRTTVINHTK